ncbi:unnamed protein product [Anisakis simplex]|uniref:Uncharacterized protein n=1 Tax=Anisakis simplex TaxID=6269 RepID=A0A3P6P1M2_ANISI|nr:unnamed protein product [Anisakis simplex]
MSSRDDGERSELHYTPLSRSVTGEDINGLNRIPYSADELQAGTAMLRRIVQDLKQQKGVTFILPLNNEDAMQLIIEPFRKLIEEGH